MRARLAQIQNKQMKDVANVANDALMSQWYTHFNPSTNVDNNNDNNNENDNEQDIPMPESKDTSNDNTKAVANPVVNPNPTTIDTDIEIENAVANPTAIDTDIKIENALANPIDKPVANPKSMVSPIPVRKHDAQSPIGRKAAIPPKINFNDNESNNSDDNEQLPQTQEFTKENEGDNNTKSVLQAKDNSYTILDDISGAMIPVWNEDEVFLKYGWFDRPLIVNCVYTRANGMNRNGLSLYFKDDIVKDPFILQNSEICKQPKYC